MVCLHQHPRQERGVVGDTGRTAPAVLVYLLPAASIYRVCTVYVCIDREVAVPLIIILVINHCSPWNDGQAERACEPPHQTPCMILYTAAHTAGDHNFSTTELASRRTHTQETFFKPSVTPQSTLYCTLLVDVDMHAQQLHS